MTAPEGSASDGLGWAVGTQGRTEQFFDLEFELAGFVVGRKSNPHALGSTGGSFGGRDPGHFAGHRVALRIIGQAEQNVDIVAKPVVPRGGNENSTVGRTKECKPRKVPLFP